MIELLAMNPGFQAYVPALNLYQVAPFAALLIGALGCLVADALSNKEGSRRILPVIAFASLIAAYGCFLLPLWPRGITFFEGFLLADKFGVLGSMTIILAMLVMVVLGPETVRRRNLPSGEYYALILFASFGMTMLTMANELITAFICIEILSLSLYVLTGIDRRSGRSTEAAFKYLILGAFASAFYVMGAGFLFGATGTTQLDLMTKVFYEGSRVFPGGIVEPLNAIYVYVGFALIFVGICFKLSLAPFHMWAPDVSEGAPTSTSMAIATSSKVGAFALLYHLLLAIGFWDPFYESSGFILSFVAAISMVWGNLAALVQSNVKRMLAFSSVAHGGYMMVGFASLMSLTNSAPGVVLEDLQNEISDSIMLYLFGYTVLNVLAFGIAHYLGKGGEGDMKGYRGLWRRSPVAATGMALAMLGLTGIPPTVGFIGKFYIFRHAVEQDLLGLAVIGVLASVVSAFYYLRLILTMFMMDEEQGATGLATTEGQVLPFGRTLVLGIASGMVFLFGVFPMIFLAMSRF